MNLPRNAYCRHLARMTGATFHKACSLPIQEWRKNGRREYFLYDVDNLVDHAWIYRAQAYRWRNAYWCSVNAGELVDGGALTVQAIIATVYNAAIIPLVLSTVFFIILCIMYAGKLFL